MSPQLPNLLAVGGIARLAICEQDLTRERL
jgi:hypothetical protein